jgi:hypothetical protein
MSPIEFTIGQIIGTFEICGTSFDFIRKASGIVSYPHKHPTLSQTIAIEETAVFC